MKLNLALSLAVCFLLTSPALSADKDELQGTWVIESFEDKGKKKDELKGGRFVFSGDSLKVKTVDVEFTFGYKTVTDKKPHQLDYTGRFAGKVVTVLAIFKIEGDTLTMCSGAVTANEIDVDSEGEPIIKQDPRPTAFDSILGSLFVLKRVKK